MVLARPLLLRGLVEVLLKNRPFRKVLAKVLDRALGEAAKGLEVVLEKRAAALQLVAELLRDLEGRHALHRLDNRLVLDSLFNRGPSRLIVKRKTNFNALRVHHFLQDVRKKMSLDSNVQSQTLNLD